VKIFSKKGFLSRINLVCTLVGLLFPAPSLAQTRLRLATLLPVGSSQYKTLQEMGQKWNLTTAGAVTLTIYAGGTMGSERDCVMRMRAGQLQAATLSVDGLSDIDPAVGAVQKIPMLYNSLEEMEYVRVHLQPDLEQRLEKKGFVVLSWADAGWIHIFSRHAYSHPQEFVAAKNKLFVTAGDQDETQIVNGLGLQAVPLEWTDVLTSLQTGLVDTIAATPFLALAGQLDLVAKNALDLKYVPLVGATVMTKKSWDALSPEVREKLKAHSLAAGAKIQAQSRAENQEAIKAMQARGLKLHQVTPELEAEWRKFLEAVYPTIRGKMVPADVFDKSLQLIAEYRHSHEAGRP